VRTHHSALPDHEEFDCVRVPWITLQLAGTTYPAGAAQQHDCPCQVSHSSSNYRSSTSAVRSVRQSTQKWRRQGAGGKDQGKQQQYGQRLSFAAVLAMHAAC
jgi:hypothetical protein